MKRTKQTVVRVDGEKPYTLSPSGNVGHPREVWLKKDPPTDNNDDGAAPMRIAKTQDEKPFLGHADYKQHRSQEEKHWDWKEGQQSSFVQGDKLGRHEAYNRSLATDGRMVGPDRENNYGHKLHVGKISRDEEGRSHFSLDNPVPGFSNNRIMKHTLTPKPVIGKEDHQANVVPGSKSVAVHSEELNVHCGVHQYDQPDGSNTRVTSGKQLPTIGTPAYSNMLKQSKGAHTYPVEYPKHEPSEPFKGAHSVNKLRSM
jgi:hypothetical protein